ncbi:MAG: F0F1 ATP synthase subunit A [Bacteroidota bacterium]|nr:F0F1 ATP synthase subunit A [Bacteroidota bacterium]
MKVILRNIFVILLLLTFINNVKAVASEENHSKKEEFNLVSFALHHVADSYSWTFYTKKDGTDASIPLPRILWNKSLNKFNLFLSTEKAIDNGYIEEHHLNHEAVHGKLLIPDSEEEYLKVLNKLKSETDKEEIKKLNAELTQLKPVDISITKNVLFMLFAAILLLWIFISIAKKYKNNPDSPPKGIQSVFEPIIIYVRDEIAKEFIPTHYKRFLPLLLSFFFFIWFLNMMGIIPFSANVTGNIAVTATLALIAMVTININGKRSYWQHIFWFPNIPVFVKPIMLVVEFISILTKPFALTIRLFANIIAGHLVILSFISLIFIFGKLGSVPAVGWATSVIAVAFSLFIDMIEILIALLQAYIFTTLSALFIGQAVETEH